MRLGGIRYRDQRADHEPSSEGARFPLREHPELELEVGLLAEGRKDDIVPSALVEEHALEEFVVLMARWWLTDILRCGMQASKLSRAVLFDCFGLYYLFLTISFTEIANTGSAVEVLRSPNG